MIKILLIIIYPFVMSIPDDINYDLSLIIYDLLPTNDKPKFVYAIDKNWFYQHHIEKEQKRTMDLVFRFIDKIDDEDIIEVIDDYMTEDCKKLVLFPILCNARYEGEDIILKIIDKFKEDIDPTIVNDDGNTILMLACNIGFSKVALKLIEIYEDKCLPNNINKVGTTALILACYKSSSKVPLKLIREFGDKCVPEQIDENICTALMWACSTYLYEVAFELIDRFGYKCIPDQIDRYGRTALMMACINGLSGVALKLIDTFEDKCLPNQINDSGKTALSIAKKNNMVELVSKLEKLKN